MEKYNRLLRGITLSSLWASGDLELKVLWITMIALADEDGQVYASVPGIANAAGIPIKNVKSKLEILLSPDPHSRTPDHEGRRIKPIPGGWKLLNHKKFHPKSDAARSREYRLRKKVQASRTVTTKTPLDEDDTKRGRTTKRTTLSGKPDAPPCQECSQVLDLLNKRTGKHYRASSAVISRLVHPRHVQYGVDACFDIIDYLADIWEQDPKMQKYLRPATLFNRRVFEGHLADIQARSPDGP